MAKTSFVQIPAGMEQSFFKCLQPGDRFVFPTIRRKNLFISRKRKKGLTVKSLLPQVSELWAGFSEPEKEAWNTAGEVMGIPGFKLFTQDQIARIKNDIAGVATPSALHQSWVGRLQIDAPADYLKIAQFHPSTYFLRKKVRGFDRYEEIKVVELVSLPLTIALSYRSNLVAVEGQTPNARFYAVVISLYQGRQIENVLEIPLDLVSGWERLEVSLSSVIGVVNGYTLFFELENLTGWLEFDNVKSYHDGQNYARDPWCNDINQTLTKVWYQIPKHWAPVELPDNSFYDTIYPSD